MGEANDQILGFSGRAGDKRFQRAGVSASVESYNIYVITTLLYIAQLENPTEAVLEAEKQAIHSIIRGPGQTWLNHKDTWLLKENFGQARSIVPLEMSAQAAKARVLHFCGRFEDGSTIAEKATQLESLRGQHNFP